jgi:hypothetical protein
VAAVEGLLHNGATLDRVADGLEVYARLAARWVQFV